MKKYFNYKILLLLIIFIAAILRISFLDKIPTGITDDELGFIINSKAVFLTGKDISGAWSPFSLTPITGDFPQAEIPYLIMAPFIGMSPLSIFWSKLPYAAISIFTVFLLYLITNKLLGRNVALMVGLFAAINPWSIFFGRTAYEAPLAIFFYLLAFYILLVSKKWNILYAIIPFFIGFYSYMGTKLILIPFSIIISSYAFFVINKRKYLKQYIILNILCISILLYFTASLNFSSASNRLSEILTPNSTEISKTVDVERRLSIESPMKVLISNKLTVWGKEVINKYIKVFSTELLFLNGEARSTFSLWYHGYFYYFDLVLLFIGFYFIYKKNKSVLLLIVSLILISPIPTILSNVNSGFAALRSSLLFPMIIILIGAGAWYLVTFRKNSRQRALIAFLLLTTYLILILNFINIYFLRNPIYNSEAFNLSNRILSSYLYKSSKEGLNVVVITNSPKNIFKHFLFDTDGYSRQASGKISSIIKKEKYELGNIAFISCDDNFKITKNTTVIMDVNISCEKTTNLVKQKSLVIPLLADGGAVYKIYNDKVCSKYNLEKYPSNFQINDFDIEHLPQDRFCKKFITNPNKKIN